MNKRERKGASDGVTDDPPKSFRDAVGPVTPLGSRVARVPPPPAATSVSPAPALPAGPPPSFEMADDGETIRGHRTGLSRTERELARGRFQVIERLDLHGLRVDESEKALARFFERVRGPVRSAVLIVHGKGTHSRGGRGVLRGEIARWLSSAPLSHHVLCFATARAPDGGAGATYVLLASRRR